MLGTIKAGVQALAEFLGIVAWFQRRDEAERNERLGGLKQENASLRAQKGQSSDANRIDEDVELMSDSELDDSLPVRRTQPKARD